MKFSTKDFFSKCKPAIFCKKSLTENFISCAVPFKLHEMGGWDTGDQAPFSNKVVHVKSWNERNLLYSVRGSFISVFTKSAKKKL